MKKILLSISLLLLLSGCTEIGNTPGKRTVSSETKTVATPTIGAGKHAVEIFADFQCPACISFAKSIAPVIEGYAEKGQLQIAYRQFPLTTIHKNAYRDALAALCGAEQGQYVEYKKALYAMEEAKAGATVSDEDRVNAAKEAGLDGASMEKCIASNRYQAQVDSDMAYGNSLHIEGTPTVMLDGKKLDLGVFRDVDMLSKFLDRIVSE